MHEGLYLSSSVTKLSRMLLTNSKGTKQPRTGTHDLYVVVAEVHGTMQVRCWSPEDLLVGTRLISSRTHVLLQRQSHGRTEKGCRRFIGLGSLRWAQLVTAATKGRIAVTLWNAPR
jgi:hypothetical protein